MANDEPVPGSREHAIITTLRNYRADLAKITDENDRATTIKAMVSRIDQYDNKHADIDKEIGPRIRSLEARHSKNELSLTEFGKMLLTVQRQRQGLLTPLSKALHKDLDNIVRNAVAPYRDRERTFAKQVQTVSKNLRSRQLAATLKARQKEFQHDTDLNPKKNMLSQEQKPRDAAKLDLARQAVSSLRAREAKNLQQHKTDKEHDRER